MNRKIKVAIIIINFNGTEDTLECLESVDKFCVKHDYSVILVDNASNNLIDETTLTEFKTEVKYIKSKKNLGFAGGNNLAVKYLADNNLDCKYVFLQNNDTVLIDNSVDRLVDKLEEDNVEIGGLVNYYYDCPSEMWQAGSYIRETKLSSKEARRFNPALDSLIFVDAIPGSSMLIKREVIRNVGLFDERYFAYYEEMDFCIRAKGNGYKVAFLPNTSILHKVGRSSTSKFKHYLRTRNTLLFYSLHFQRYMSTAYLRALLRTIREVLTGNFDWGFVSSFISGVKDYRNHIFYEGHISSFQKHK